MKTTTKKVATETIVSIEGRVNTTTAPELKKVLAPLLEETTELILDFTDVVFISSAGIGVVVWAHKELSGRGRLVLRNVSDDLREIFEMTGLDGFLNFA